MANPVPTPSRQPLRPVPRKRQAYVLAILTMIVGGLVMGVWTVIFSQAPLGAVAVLVSLVASVGCILLYRWIDRWEPEPPHLLIAAFLWGGGVSLVLTLIFTLATPALSRTTFLAVAVQAPLVEELAKGLFLWLLVLQRKGRHELNSLTDALVYAGFLGTGFSFVEDMGYLAGSRSAGDLAVVAGFRIGLGVFGHSVYVAMTALGLWFGLQSRGAGRFGFPVLGYLAAVLLHGMHNAAAMTGIGGYLVYQVVVGLTTMVGVVLLVRWSRRREGTVLHAQLPAMVRAGMLSPQEAGWMARIDAAKVAPTEPRLRADLLALRESVLELAFLRDRLDRGVTTSDLHQQHEALVGLITARYQPVAPWLAGGGFQGMTPVQPGQARTGSALHQYALPAGQQPPRPGGPGTGGPGAWGPGPAGHGPGHRNQR